MKKHAINKLIEFYGLSKFKNNAEQDLFSVYFYETDTAILCHSGIFFEASMIKATKEQYMKNLSDAFKIIPVGAANIFKESLGLTALHNCKTSFGKDPIEFNISQNQANNKKQNALLKASFDNNNNISIDSIYSPMPESLNFNSSGSYIANNNTSNKPMQIIDYFAKHNINQFFNIPESQEQAEVTPSEFTTSHLKFLYFSNNAEDINLVYNLSLLKELMLTKQPDKSKYTEQFTKAFRIMNNSDTKILRSLARACKFNTTVREIEENSIEAEKHILFDQNSSGSSDSLNISLNKNKFNISIGDCSFNIDTNGNIDFPVSENSPIE